MAAARVAVQAVVLVAAARVAVQAVVLVAAAQVAVQAVVLVAAAQAHRFPPAGATQAPRATFCR